MKMANFLFDRLISLGLSRICGVPGDYNLEFMELLVVHPMTVGHDPRASARVSDLTHRRPQPEK